MKKSESAAIGSNTPCPKNSYWAIDGLLLAGEYPGSQDPIAARSKLTHYLDLGVRLSEKVLVVETFGCCT